MNRCGVFFVWRQVRMLRLRGNECLENGKESDLQTFFLCLNFGRLTI